MPRKVGIPTHRGHGPGPEPPGGLSEDRLALVHRYMTGEGEEVAPVQPRYVRPEERPDSSERPSEPTATVRRPERPRATGEIERAADAEAGGREAVTKADKQSAKRAARRIAALEKKEARERKALAKAAARRKRASSRRSLP